MNTWAKMVLGTLVGGAVGAAYASLPGGCAGGVCPTNQNPLATILVFAALGASAVFAGKN